MAAWYPRIALAAAVAVAVTEILLASRAVVILVVFAPHDDPANLLAPGYVVMAIAAPIVVLGALGGFTLFSVHAAAHGAEDGFLGVAVALALSLGVLYFVAPRLAIASPIATLVAGCALIALRTWRALRTRQSTLHQSR